MFLPRINIQQSSSWECSLSSSIVTFRICPPRPWRSFPLKPNLTQSIKDLPGCKATLGRFPATGPTVLPFFISDPSILVPSGLFILLSWFSTFATRSSERACESGELPLCGGDDELFPQPRLSLQLVSKRHCQTLQKFSNNHQISSLFNSINLIYFLALSTGQPRVLLNSNNSHYWLHKSTYISDSPITRKGISPKRVPKNGDLVETP